MIDNLYFNPWRPPDARWKRAIGITERAEPQATVNRDGRDGCYWVRQAQRFKRAWDQARTERDKLAVISRQPFIYQAFWIYTQASDNQPLRWTIEARILARETDKEISYKMGCRPEVVAAYEALFFAVRERIDNRDFILNSVLSAAIIRGLNARAFDLLWKMFGYCAGPHVLDDMMQYVPPNWVHTAGGASTFYQDTAIMLMKKKAAVASLAIPVTDHTQVHLLEAFVKYVEIERSTDSAGKAQEQISNNLQALLTSLKPVAVTVDKISDLAAYDTGAVELRNEERLNVRLGLPGTDLTEIAEFAYPETRSA